LFTDVAFPYGPGSFTEALAETFEEASWASDGFYLPVTLLIAVALVRLVKLAVSNCSWMSRMRELFNLRASSMAVMLS
jgi:hypothetical protein